MNHKDIRLLQSMRGYPALSILAPMQRSHIDNQQDQLRIKNLVTEATNRLLNEFPRREIEMLLSRLDELVASIDYGSVLDGVAIFVNQDSARLFSLPFAPIERVVVDESFATRDLVRTINHTQRYWVLMLSEQPTRLFEGVGETLIEVKDGGFPMTHSGPGGATRLPGGKGINRSAYRDDQHRQFFRKVDDAFQQFYADDLLPLAVVGVDRYLSFLREVSALTDANIVEVKGNYDRASTFELAKIVWPQMEIQLTALRHQVLEDLDVAVGAQKYASTIGEVWRLAYEGRGRTLVVEENYHYPATSDESGMHITPASDAALPGVIDDAVDEVIETVLAKGGQVVFVDDGTLEQHQRVALILRY